MKNSMKRLLSMLLVMAMVVSMFPVSAFATDVEGEQQFAEQPVEIVAEPPVHEHSYEAGASTASCTAEGTVTYVCGCGDSYEELAAATGHSYVAGETVPASCEVDGSVTMTCAACGDSYVETLPAGHSYVETAKLDATCTVDGSITMTCSACGHSYTDPMVAPGHSMSYDILDATCTEDGYTKGICTVCGENFEEVHMALGHAWINGVCDRCDVVYYDLMMATETAVDMLAVYNTGDVAARMSLYLEQLNDLNEKTEAFETLTDEEISVLDEAAAKRATEEVEAKEELLAAWAELIAIKLEAEKPAVDEAVAAVQAMIDALPTVFTSQDEVDAFWLHTEDVDAAIDALTEEQQAQLKTENYDAAIDAAAAFFNPDFDNAGTFDEPAVVAEADGWYWEGNTLYIKNGSITKGQLYAAFVGKWGSGSYKYATSKPTLGWSLGGTEVKNDDNTAVNVSEGNLAVGKAGSWGWVNAKDYTVSVEFYYDENQQLAANSTASIGLNPAKSVASQMYGTGTVNGVVSLEEELYNKLIKADECVGFEGLSFDDFTYQYKPAKKLDLGIGAVDWMALSADETNMYAFAERFKGGTTAATEKVKLTHKETGMFIEAEINFYDSRPVQPGHAGAAEQVTLSGNAETDAANIKASAAAAVTGTASGASITYTVGSYTIPEPGVTGTTVPVNVVIAANESYQGTEFTVNVPIYTENSPAKITVSGGEHGTVEVPSEAFAENGDVTVKVTPESGYYVESVTVNGIAVNGSYANTDIDSGWGSDMRNVFTGAFTVENNESYNVNVTITKFEWALPMDAVEVKLNGYMFNGITSVGKEAIVKAIYGEEVNASLYEGNVDEGWGSITIKLGTPFQYKVTLKATDMYPAVSDTIMVTATDNRLPAEISNSYVNGSEYNTEAEFKATFEASVKFNGSTADFSGLTDIGKNGEIKWTKNDDGTYKAEVTAQDASGWTRTTKTFEGLTWNVAKYRVTFLSENNEILAEAEYAYGTPAADVVKPAIPEKEGYSPVEWSVADVTGDATYIATYTINKYTVTWTVDDEAYGEPTEVVYGETITAPEYTAPAGYTFSGWDVPATMPAENITLNATLTPINYTVTWVWQNAEGQQTTEQTLPYGTAIVVPAEIPTKYEDGNVTYTIVRWTGLTDGATVPVDGVSYTAVYTTATAWIVDFDSIGGTEVQDVTVVVNDGETVAVTEPDEPTREGYRFDGWMLDGAKYDFATSVTGNITLTAKWVEQVTVSFDGAEIEAQTFDINGTATKPADPSKDQAIFGGWLLNGEEYDFTATVTESIILTAKWIEDLNSNNVPDADEIFSVKVTKANDADAVAISGEGLVKNPLSTADSTVYIFDSTKNTITITATPVVAADGKSTTYVKSIGEAELSFNDKFVATAEIAVENGDEIVVEFADANFVINEERVMNYYAGMKNVAQKDLYDIIASAPNYDDADEVTITYKAREAMTHEISLDILKNGNLLVDGAIDLLKKATINGVIENGKIQFKMDELWLPVDVENKDPFPDSLPLETAVDNFLDTHDFGDLISDLWSKITSAKWNEVGSAISDFFAPVYESAMYYGAHRFGYNNTGAETLTEEIKVTYKNGERYIEAETTVDLIDLRLPSTISGGNVTVAFRDYTDAELIELIGVKVNEVPDAVISCEQINEIASFEGKVVSEEAYKLNFEFKGNDEYKPSKAEFTVTVTKAALSMDLPNINVTQGEGYSAAPTYTMGNSHGVREEIDESLIQFIVGLDVAEFDVNQDGVTGLNGKIQLILSKDLQELLDGALKLAGKDPINGIDMSLAELMDYLSLLGDSTIESVQQIFDAISGITEAGNLTVTLGGSYPVNTGAYLYGAVSTNPNYETAYDVAYLLIAPATVQVPLEWNYVDDNNIFSYQLLQYIDLGATTGDAELDKLVHTLFMGFDQNGELLLSWNGAELGNGAYVELAFLVEFGNTLYYAVPLVRPVVIVPSAVEVQLVGATGDHNRDLHKVFNGQNQGFSVKVFEEGEMIYSDHYQDAVNMLPEGAELKVTYLGVQTNGQTYNSTVQPIHAGAYTAIASYIYIDENGNLNELGADAGVLVIEPSESTITMSETETVLFGENYNVVDTMDIKASSVNAPAEFVTDPDFTVITASVAATNDVSENGWAGVTGNVNVDFPKWVDTLLGIEEDDVLDAGNLVAEIEKVSNSIDSVIAMLGLDANATAEVKDAVLARVEESFAKVNELLTQLPANTSITFKSDYAVNAVGAYAVVAVVTDSDHYPSVDAGLLVIEPELTQAYLKFDYEDANGIFTKTLLSYIDLDATAYTDETYTTVHADDAKVVDAFLTIDSEGNLVTITDESKLTNGAWLQVSYIPFEIGGHMAFSDLIARPVIIVPDVGTVELVYTDAKDTQDKFEFKFDGTGKALQVAYNGELADAEDYTIYYEGVQTNGKYYERSTTAPVHAGAYIAIADYRAVSANGDADAIGNDIAVITIDLAESSISVTGGTVTYDGEEHKATITTDGRCDKTIISGYVNVTGAVDTVGVDAFVGNVNIDFPRWVDEIIATYEFGDGITPAYMKDLLESYVDEIMAKLPVDALAYIGMSQEDVEAAAFAVFNEIISLLEKMPQDISITFNSDVAYTAPGAYLYLGIVTDSDRVPSYDTGLLVIEKMKNKFDMLDTTVTYNGEEQFVKYVNEYNTDYFTMIVDRETNTVNLVLDPDMMYVLDKLQQLTGYNLADGVPVSSLYSQLNAEELAAAIIAIIEDVEAAAVLNPAGDLNKVLTMLKTELENLPTSGQFVVNQPLPVDVGTYEVYTMAFAEFYTTEFSKAVLNIVPAKITVTAENKTKAYGEADPELTYIVEGLVEGDEINVTIAREPGEDIGIYAITLVADAGKNYTVIVNNGTFTVVEASVTGVALDKDTLTLGKDETAELTATVAPENATNKKVTWSSSDESVVTVDENGNITAVGGGTATITVTTEDGGYTATCTVTVNVPVENVTLDKTELELTKGESATLTATVTPADATNKKVIWTSSDSTIATVDENGKVTAVGRGTATITVTTVEGEFTATCTVTVRYGFPIYFTNANDAAIVAPGMTVLIDGVPYVLDENCTAWAEEDDDHRRIALLYDYTEQGDAANPFEYADHCENMYVWDLERNEETAEYTANRVTELDNVLKFSGGSIWLSGSGVNGIRAYYDYKGTAEAFAKLGYEVVSHGTVLDWAENLGATGEAERRYTEGGASANFAAGHYEGGNTYTDTIYPASEKYVSSPVRMRFYAELKDIEPDAETGETEDIMLYSGSVQRSIGYIAWQNRDAYNGTVYDNYVEKIIDQARDHLIEEGLIEG